MPAACNADRYRDYGCTGHHRSCCDNMHEALQELLGRSVPFRDVAPFNLW